MCYNSAAFADIVKFAFIPFKCVISDILLLDCSVVI